MSLVGIYVNRCCKKLEAGARIKAAVWKMKTEKEDNCQ